MVEVIPLKFGVVFKRIFSNPAVFNRFAQDVLGIPVQIDQVHMEYEYDEPVGFVKSQYDLFAEDKTNRLVIEIQQIKDIDFFDRFLYYHLISMVEQVRNSYKYNFERTVYTIVVLTSTPKDGSVDFNCAVSDFSPVGERGQRLAVYPHRLIFLAPRLVNADTPPALRQWLEFILDSLDGKMDEQAYPDQMFQQMIENIRKQTISPAELARIKDESAWEEAKLLFAAEGRQEGREAGREEGIEKGIAIGMEKGIYKMVQAMSERGLSVEQIASLTGLSATETLNYLNQE